jgi:hypothetical protein
VQNRAAGLLDPGGQNRNSGYRRLRRKLPELAPMSGPFRHCCRRFNVPQEGDRENEIRHCRFPLGPREDHGRPRKVHWSQRRAAENGLRPGSSAQTKEALRLNPRWRPQSISCEGRRALTQTERRLPAISNACPYLVVALGKKIAVPTGKCTPSGLLPSRVNNSWRSGSAVDIRGA